MKFYKNNEGFRGIFIGLGENMLKKKKKKCKAHSNSYLDNWGF